MLLDIYRDQALEKLLIVEYRNDIKGLATLSANFLEGLIHQRNIDTDSDKLPNGIDTDEVIEAVKARGYFAATLTVTITEIDG
ncbi:hypothetical protein GHO45_17145 [Pseudomonas sp. FSL R10-0765]|uniref:Uncharacterized protein n=1 Tax=uncultured Caudovirales phage TaxID=2100421 RepID=A0A2H4J888_9CAUD|nr:MULTISPECIES: hypothetical protein [unclassified Pseudomonas]ASN71484.1 hypothetical protein 9F1_26 [uncultured Caudovirales phage]MQT42649.1 hypothetical protein [Pseudomonas sp. FSL R10-0765]MQU03436.1 hypothetical protein [Pseudomonas sp. FSL R10-2245]